MTKLTLHQQEMLDGKYGEFKQKAMEFIVSYANVLGAPSLCKISHATIPLGFNRIFHGLTKENFAEQFSKLYFNCDHTVPFGNFSEGCTVFNDALTCDMCQHEPLHLPDNLVELNNSILDEMCSHGVSIVSSCTPYYVGWLPLPGDHFVTVESSNVLMSNSYFGAYGNTDGAESAVCAAITGYTPLWGLHCRENRYANVEFRVECSASTLLDWNVLGHTIGRLLPTNGQPVLSTGFDRPRMDMLRQFFASLASTSAAQICHIAGVTPEARDLSDALGGRKPADVITVTQQDYEESFNELCDPGSGHVDLVSLGCPHFSLEDLRIIAKKLQGKKVALGTELWIWTDYATQAMAQRNGYQDAIEQSGARLFNSSCPIMMREQSHGFAKSILLDSAKQAKNLRAQSSAKIYFADLDACIDSAISGYWDESRHPSINSTN